MRNKNLFREYEKVLEDAEESSNVRERKERIFGYNPFVLQDAIGERNKKKMWLEYEKLRLSGVEAEELIYKIISKVRDMTAIKMGADGENLGIKNYTFFKSRRDLKNWEEKDLKNFYTKLVEIYHRSHMGDDELDVALERALLSI